MAIRFTCPSCQTQYSVNDRYAGKRTSCKTCGVRLQVPTNYQPTTASAGETPGAPAASPNGVPRRPATRHPVPPALPDRDWLVDDGNEPVPLTFGQLQQMAADGRLRRRDFVRRKGDRRWRRAGRVISPWPVTKPTPEEQSLLTTCGACCGQIAKEAPHCPKCGAPNKWQHPEVVRFFRRLRRFQRCYNGFEAEGQGFVLVGKSPRPKQFLDYAANAVGGMGFFGSMSVGGLLTMLGASIGSQYAADALRKSAGPNMRAFVIDFRHRPPVWNTTDDEFWENVLDFFDLV